MPIHVPQLSPRLTIMFLGKTWRGLNFPEDGFWAFVSWLSHLKKEKIAMMHRKMKRMNFVTICGSHLLTGPSTSRLLSKVWTSHEITSRSDELRIRRIYWKSVLASAGHHSQYGENCHTAPEDCP